MKKGVIFFLLILLSVGISTTITAQDSKLSTQELETSAISNFEAGDFEEALEYINSLLDIFPKDPRFNYYSGVCLVEIGRNFNTAIYQLKLAALGDVSEDVNFYIGRAYYHLGDPGQTAKYFTRFEKNSTRDIQRRVEYEKWKNLNSTNTPPPENLNSRTGSRKPEPTDYDRYISEALDLQEQADSVRTIINDLHTKQNMDDPEPERQQIETQILTLENQANDLQLQANDSYLRARALEKSGSLSDFSLPGDEVTYNFGDQIPGRGGNDYIEQVSDAFYKQKEIRKILRVSEITRLSELDDLNRTGNKLMKDAYDLEREKSQQEVAASGASSASQNRKALDKIDKLEEKISEKRLKAFKEYQYINEGKYAVYDGTLEKILVNQGILNFNVIDAYYNDARESHRKAIDSRKKAESTTDFESQLDNYGNSNAYELIALYNQKQALGTFAGIVNTRAASPPVSESSTQKVSPVSVKEEPRPEAQQIEESQTKIAEQAEKPIPQSKVEAKEEAISPPVAVVIKEPIQVMEQPVEEEIEEKGPDPNQDHFNEFAVLPTPDYNMMLPIPFDEDLPEGVIYKIQMAAFKSPKPQSYFRGLEPITAEHIQYAIRYYVGRFSMYEDSKEALKKVKKMGFKDAFVVAYVNGYRSTLDKARGLEADPGFKSTNKPVSETATIQSGASIDNVIFKLQIGAFSSKLSPDMHRTFENYAGTKKVTFTTNNKGLFIYTIGNFSTFEEARSFNKELKEIGIKDAFVIAFKNDKKVPLSEIRED